MDPLDFIGYSAVLLSSISIVPQIRQICKTKQVEDINRCFFILYVLSEVLYITYGGLKNDYVMIASTIPPILSHLLIIMLHCKYKNRTPEVQVD